MEEPKTGMTHAPTENEEDYQKIQWRELLHIEILKLGQSSCIYKEKPGIMGTWNRVERVSGKNLRKTFCF